MTPRALIVDDTADMRALVRAVLTSAGTCVVIGEACDGREAVDLAERLRPDVVVMDLMMPVMDGFAAMPLIRERVPECRIVAFSAYDCADDAIAAGADVFVPKLAVVSDLPDAVIGASL